MDSNELMKELYDTLKESGWYDKATSYFKEHHELFSEGLMSGSMIASINMSVSYQPESLSDMSDMLPNVFISTGNFNSTMYEYNVYDDNEVRLRTWNDGEIIKEVTSHV